MGQFRVAFFPTDLATSTAFYVDLLGFAPLESWDRPDSQGVLIDAGGAIIELLAPSPEGTTLRTSGLSISIEVADAERRWKDLHDRGVEPLTETVEQPWGHRNFSATDPDGIVLSFFQVLGER